MSFDPTLVVISFIKHALGLRLRARHRLAARPISVDRLIQFIYSYDPRCCQIFKKQVVPSSQIMFPFVWPIIVAVGALMLLEFLGCNVAVAVVIEALEEKKKLSEGASWHIEASALH